jgi:hypothetical protein
VVEWWSGGVVKVVGLFKTSPRGQICITPDEIGRIRADSVSMSQAPSPKGTNMNSPGGSSFFLAS